MDFIFREMWRHCWLEEKDVASIYLTFIAKQSLFWASLVTQLVKNPLAMWETWVWSLGWEDPLKKGKATYSSILAWKSHGQRILTGYSPCGYKELDTTEELTHTITLLYEQQNLREAFQNNQKYVSFCKAANTSHKRG